MPRVQVTLIARVPFGHWKTSTLGGNERAGSLRDSDTRNARSASLIMGLTSRLGRRGDRTRRVWLQRGTQSGRDVGGNLATVDRVQAGDLLLAGRDQVLATLIATPVVECEGDPVFGDRLEPHVQPHLVEGHQLRQVDAGAARGDQCQAVGKLDQH